MNPKHTPSASGVGPDSSFDARLDAALRADHDILLPSSGFADSVMAAVRQDQATAGPRSSAPFPPLGFPPLPFPWKRALPGLIAGTAAALLAFATLAALLITSLSQQRHASHSAFSEAVSAWQPALLALLHSAISPDVVWPLVSLALPLLCLLLVRRLLLAR